MKTICEELRANHKVCQEITRGEQTDWERLISQNPSMRTTLLKARKYQQFVRKALNREEDDRKQFVKSFMDITKPDKESFPWNEMSDSLQTIHVPLVYAATGFKKWFNLLQGKQLSTYIIFYQVILQRISREDTEKEVEFF